MQILKNNIIVGCQLRANNQTRTDILFRLRKCFSSKLCWHMCIFLTLSHSWNEDQCTNLFFRHTTILVAIFASNKTNRLQSQTNFYSHLIRGTGALLPMQHLLRWRFFKLQRIYISCTCHIIILEWMTHLLTLSLFIEYNSMRRFPWYRNSFWGLFLFTCRCSRPRQSRQFS